MWVIAALFVVYFVLEPLQQLLWHRLTFGRPGRHAGYREVG